LTKEIFRDKIFEMVVGHLTDWKGAKMNRGKLETVLTKKYGPGLQVMEKPDCIEIKGTRDSWTEIIDICSFCVGKIKGKRVVNDLCLKNVEIPKMNMPDSWDKTLENSHPDVLVIGGGISGASIARELTKWKLKVLLVEKESDLALQASGRNDGEVHPGVDLKRGSLKHKYVVRGNQMYDQVCKDLDVPFVRRGQYVGFTDGKMRPLLFAYALQKKYRCKIKDTKIINQKTLRKQEPNLNPEFKFALYNPSAGCVCPYGLTIAYGENAMMNGANIQLETAVISMEVNNGSIISVQTNKGIIYPKLVINAAGIFAEDIAAMANDRFYSIHPRRGTNSILDKKAANNVRTIASIKELGQSQGHTKGGGILHTVHDNLLVGPDAVETYEKENVATNQESIDRVFEKQSKTSPDLKKSDIITYFTGVRAATFEEDYVIEPGHQTRNLIHCGGIQSPGLTTAPAVAVDVAKMAVNMLQKEMNVIENMQFNPKRKGIEAIAQLPLAERDKRIKQNPDYGKIICRCEEISKGEIIDALNSPLRVETVDGIKRRARPGMGRCQGGFCLPLVMDIIHEYTGKEFSTIKKSDSQSCITYGSTKEALK